jgi:uncharacterized membrane protein YphA (DoxX/SURF4 family)
MINVFSHIQFVLAAFSFSPFVFWPYLFGAVTLVVGLAMATRTELWQAYGSDKLIWFGPLSFALAMAIFGGDHMAAAKFIAIGIPSWIPGHLFWAYFVGVALIVAALSLATGIQWRLAAFLLGVMIFLFVLILHIPALFAAPRDQIKLTIALRDLALSGGALAIGVSQRDGSLVTRFQTFARFLVAIPIAVFGIDQFMNPAFAPGIPQESSTFFFTLPDWFPAHVFWTFLSGMVFLVCSLGMFSRKYAHSAARFLGGTLLLLTVLIYLPLTVSRASDVANGLNYLAIHLALAGSALFLAASFPAPSPLTERSGKLVGENVAVFPEKS